METVKKLIAIIGDKRDFNKSEVDDLAITLNRDETDGHWDVAVGRTSTKGSKLTLFRNNCDVHPQFKFEALGFGISAENKVKFKLINYSTDYTVEHCHEF